jgi:hypothetical protein
MATIAASNPTLSKVSGAVMVEIMSAPTSNSSPSRIAPYVGAVTRIGGSPVHRARTRAEERRCGQHNPSKDDGDASEFQHLGKLINDCMGLLGQHADLLRCHNSKKPLPMK